MPTAADISSVVSHSDSWTVIMLDGEKYVVPQDSRNRHAKAILQWIADGGTVDSGEAGPRKRLRDKIEGDPVARVFFLELADMSNRTPQAMLTALLSHID